MLTNLYYMGLSLLSGIMKLVPMSALDPSDPGQPRFDKILDLIENCKYSIHDISRTEIDPNHGLPRFNVPFELGLDLGCKRYGKRRHKRKTDLILDVDRYRYRKFISDIAGFDIEEHQGSVANVITVVRNWLRNAGAIPFEAAGGATIYTRYQAG